MRAPRSRSVSTKVTEDQYQQLAQLAGADTISAWTRQILIKATEHEPVHVNILAEVLALRKIVLNLMYATLANEAITEQRMWSWIREADESKFIQAYERLAADIPARSTRSGR